MKKLYYGFASLLLACGITWAQQSVTVYDVGVAPDSPNKKVTVTYRLAGSEVGVANVSMDISSNAGETWTIPANTYYPGSDIGPGIPADGTLRQLIWDARTDWNQQYSTQMMVRLNATVAELQNGLFFCAANKLYRMNLDGSAMTVLCSGLSKPEHLFVDSAHNKLMIDTWYSGSPILGYNMLQGGSATLLYNGPGMSGAQGFAYDPDASTIFMSLYYNGIYKLDLQSTQGWQLLGPSSALSPMIGANGQMVLDPAHQQIFFRAAYNGTCDQCRWIWRVNYDGTGLAQVIQANMGLGLAIDPSAGHLYFSDEPGDGPVKRCNLNGTEVQTLLTVPAPYNVVMQIVLDLSAGKMYMYLANPTSSNWQERAIARASLDGSGFEILKEFNSGGANGWGLALFNP